MDNENTTPETSSESCAGIGEDGRCGVHEHADEGRLSGTPAPYKIPTPTVFHETYRALVELEVVATPESLKGLSEDAKLDEWMEMNLTAALHTFEAGNKADNAVANVRKIGIVDFVNFGREMIERAGKIAFPEPGVDEPAEIPDKLTFRRMAGLVTPDEEKRALSVADLLEQMAHDLRKGELREFSVSWDGDRQLTRSTTLKLG